MRQPPSPSPAPLDRRAFLAASAALGAAACRGAYAEEAEDSPIAFFAVSDTHYLAEKENPGKFDPHSREVTSRFVETLNGLAGSPLPEEAGGGVVRAPRGVIHAGDLIDSGDKQGRVYEQMQRTEWEAYTADFGIDGREGRLRYPVFDVHGNHDGPQSVGVAIDGLIERNRRRTGLAGLSENGLHCSWDWGPVHFLNLGIVVGQTTEGGTRRYAPRESLDFLVDDLKQHVGESGRPVVITHHIDIARYTIPCDPDDEKNRHREWHPCDVQAFHEALRGYRVAAILHGHTHARQVHSWDGRSMRAEGGRPVFNIDNSAHFHGGNQAFFYFEIGREELVARECLTTDGWRTHRWTPQVWRTRV